ncbi:hypothetical protein BsWGS_18506 [Bradybaena similaris]
MCTQKILATLQIINLPQNCHCYRSEYISPHAAQSSIIFLLFYYNECRSSSLAFTCLGRARESDTAHPTQSDDLGAKNGSQAAGTHSWRLQEEDASRIDRRLHFHLRSLQGSSILFSIPLNILLRGPYPH